MPGRAEHDVSSRAEHDVSSRAEHDPLEEGGVRALLRQRWFPWLYGTRLVSQTADGIFQGSLASAVFFSPDHQTDPKQAAAGFVVLLLPYSLVGPFAGVFLDRWSRQRVLVRANLVRSVFVAATALLLATTGARGVAFYVAALCALSVNRFYLSALSAALPHVVQQRQLVLANSVTTTSGTAVSIAGLGIAVGLRHLVGSGDGGGAVVALSSIAIYLTAAAVATRMPTRLLGPHEQPVALRHALGAVAQGFADGAAHLRHRPVAARVLLALGGARLLYGMSTIGTLLLYRNYFHDHGVLRAGFAGLGQAFAASAVGYVLAAFVTPVVSARLGKPRWVVTVFAAASVAQIAFGLPFAIAPLLAGAAVLGFTTQSAKICADTIVQEEVDDDFRGRVFSLYDTLFNMTFVTAAVLAAFVLPVNGKSYPVLIAIGTGYAVIAALYGASERPTAPPLTVPSAAKAGT